MSAERKNRAVEAAYCRPGSVLPVSRAPGMKESGVRAAQTARRPDHRLDVALEAPDATAKASTNEAPAAAPPFAYLTSPIRRLHSFDCQTGRLLAKPYWVDDVGYHAKATLPLDCVEGPSTIARRQ